MPSGQEIGFRCEQEAELRRVARERLARFQEVWIDRARKEWELLTSEQQAAMPALVKRQGPTSAVLSMAWELGFDYDRLVPSHPMLAEAPVRQRLGLSAAQESQLDPILRRPQEGQSASGNAVPRCAASAIRIGLGRRVEEAGGGYP